MSVSSIDQVLAQIRVLRAEASGNPELAAPVSDQVNFSSMLKDSIDSVNETQVKASEMKTAFELGREDLNLAEVMIASQKSSVAFEGMVQVRNKLIEAYKEVMNMPI